MYFGRVCEPLSHFLYLPLSLSSPPSPTRRPSLSSSPRFSSRHFRSLCLRPLRRNTHSLPYRERNAHMRTRTHVHSYIYMCYIHVRARENGKKFESPFLATDVLSGHFKPTSLPHDITEYARDYRTCQNTDGLIPEKFHGSFSGHSLTTANLDMILS